MATATLSKKYQVVVPQEIRTRMNLGQGARIVWYPIDEDRAVLARYPKSVVTALRGLGKDLWRGLGGTRKYIRQERATWKR